MRTTRHLRSVPAWTAGVAFVLAACGGGGDDASDTTDPPPATSESADEAPPDPDTAGDENGDTDGAAEPVTVPQVESSPPDVTMSGLSIYRGDDIDGAPEPLVPLEEVRSGGPPPDGIPSIDEPTFLRPDDVDFLEENEPVLAVEIDGDARVYPIQILMWHELVNDTIADIPVTISYCPLCNSAVAYDRRHDDMVLEFGTSGLLWNSALVMYDRQTETLWSHFTAEGIVGELTGETLETFPLSTVPWGVWRDANPDGLVLSRDTGHDRNYGSNPYPGYDDVNSSPFLFDGEVDGRYAAMTRIVGVEQDGVAVGVTLTHLQEERVVSTVVGDVDLVVFWQPGTASALDAGSVAGGDDIGATGVFVPDHDGEPLTFRAEGDDAFVDDETGSTWNLLGEAVDGPAEGARLEAVPHVDTFWFAWAAFRPDTVVVDG